jgi:hypothetical protein
MKIPRIMKRQKPDMHRLEELAIEFAAHLKALPTGNDPTFDAKTAHLEELNREISRALGLCEEEITRIEQEAEAAVEEQIEAALRVLPKRTVKKLRKVLRRRS